MLRSDCQRNTAVYPLPMSQYTRGYDEMYAMV